MAKEKLKCVFDHDDFKLYKVYYIEVYDSFQDTIKCASLKHFLANFVFILNRRV